MLTGAVAWWVSFHVSEKSMARFPNPQLAQQWRQRLDRFAESDLTIAEFCQLEGVSKASFYHWRRKLTNAKQSGAPTFVPINLPTADLQRSLPSSIEVILPGGARINLPAGWALTDCRDLIQAVVDATAGLSNANNDEVVS